jgi:hypothetical protein
MFVRWKRKRRKDTYHFEPDPPGVKVYSRRRIADPQWLRSAVLVESVRVDGRPRQRTIKYLGSIRECHLDLEGQYSIFHRGYFWRSADANLERLDLSDLERARIIAALEDVVPRPDPEERAQALKRAEERIAMLSASLRGR